MRNLTCLTDKVIAHRGLHDNKNIPENSIPSFIHALNKNYSIELDVRLTKDKKIVIFHDENLKRMCGVNKKVDDITYDEILRYNLLNTKYKIPLLKEVLNIINGKTFLLIELKNFKLNNDLEKKLVKLLDNYNGSFAIQSFNVFSIYWFKKNRKNYIRGLLSGDLKNKKVSNLRKILAKTLIFDCFLKTDFISYDINSLPNIYVTNIRKRKIVISWTIKNKKTYQKAIKYSDNFIGENFALYM